MTWLRAIEPWLRKPFQLWSVLSRRLSLGVRGIVLDQEGRVLLVEHTYLHGWYLPGGGVERGETAEAAVVRELMEEGGVRVIGRPRLLSIHDNRRLFPGDHVLVYRVDRWEPCPMTAVREIARVGWFHPDALPDTVTPSTRLRLAEALEGGEADPMW